MVARVRSQLAVARRRARNQRLGRNPDVPRSGGLAARQRRDEIVEHLLGIGLAMQVTARQTISEQIAGQIPEQIPEQTSQQPTQQLPAPVLQSIPRPTTTSPSGPAEGVDDTSDRVRRARLRVVRDGEVPPPVTDVPLYTALSEIFAQDSVRRTAADLAGARRHRPHRGPGRRSVARPGASVSLELGGAGAPSADTLGGGYEQTALMRYLVDVCVELLELAGAGVVLADGDGRQALTAFSSAQAESLDDLQFRTRRGPCWDCMTTGAVQSVTDIAAQAVRWPQFATLATQQGFRSVHAVPLRMRLQTIGSLSLYRTTPGELAEDDRRVAQALADLAMIRVMQQCPTDHSILVKDQVDQSSVDHAQWEQAQLDHELSSRVAIEQAKGVLAQFGRMDTDRAFLALQACARRKRIDVVDLSQGLVDRRYRPSDILAPPVRPVSPAVMRL